MNQFKTMYDLLVQRDYPTLFERIRRRFEITFSEEDLKTLLERKIETKSVYVPRRGIATDDCFVMWLKNRLEEIGAFKVDLNPPRDTQTVVSAILHIAFLSLEETEEHLWRLRHGGVYEQHEDEPRYATSKIFVTPGYAHPVDRTAARVAPEPSDHKETS